MDNLKFDLNNVETERAVSFIEKHNHHEEFIKEGRLAFSTLGMQFTYMITPGGLGNSVQIKCNHCGAQEDITDISNW